VKVAQKERTPTFFLTSSAAAVVDAVIVTSTSLKLRIEIVSLVVFTDLAVAIYALSFNSRVAAIAGVAIAGIGALWSAVSLVLLIRERADARDDLRARIEDLSRLAGLLEELRSAARRKGPDEESRVGEGWGVIQNYLDTLQRLAEKESRAEGAGERSKRR
jgi:hypothetical protein